MKERVMKWIGVLTFAGLIVGCAQETLQQETPIPIATEKIEEEVITEVEEVPSPTPSKKEIYQNMIQRSLVSTGNNHRLKNVIEKAKKGEAVNIAYIGGSITEGASASSGKCYADQSFLSFKELFGQGDANNINYVNAGMGGTPSALGIMRYERDVLERLEALPDIVFIEFSVNDWQETTSGRAYESMIRNILSADNEPAVVLVFSVFQSRWNMQDLYIPIGNAYGLPMVSIRDAVVPALDEEKTLQEDLFFADQYHPTTYGHKIMTDCLTYLFETVDGEEMNLEDSVLPTDAVIGKDFVGIKMVDTKSELESVTIQKGSFTSVDENLVPLANLGGRKTFPDNWQHKSGDGTKPFSITTTCKNMMLVYKESSSENAGSVDVYVDGTLTQTIDACKAGGWNNPIAILVLDEEISAPHTVELRLSEGSEDKEFSILALGYTE